MAQLAWTESMSVGHAGLDGQHRTLLDLYNRFDTATTDGGSQAELRDILFALEDYTHRHFAAEEAVLAGLGYPQLAEHSARHRELEQRLAGFWTKLAAGPHLAGEVRDFLETWWRDHILGDDVDYGKTLFTVDRPTERA